MKSGDIGREERGSDGTRERDDGGRKRGKGEGEGWREGVSEKRVNANSFLT